MNLYIIHIGKLDEADTENKLQLIGPFNEYPTGLPMFNPGLVVDLKDPTAWIVAPGPILEKLNKNWPMYLYGNQLTPFQPIPQPSGQHNYIQMLDSSVTLPEGWPLPPSEAGTIGRILSWKQTGTTGEIVFG